MGKGKAARFLPALLVGVFRRGHLIAVQRLFLDPQTAARTARMMLGNSRGGLWPSRFSGPEVAIAEGFESACAYRQLTGREVGTCFGVRNFVSFEPPSSVSRFVLLPDNDDEGHSVAAHALRCRQGAGGDWAVQSCPLAYGDWAELVRPFWSKPAA
jgi:hypothetical protein